MDKIKDLFSDPQREQDYQDFERRYREDAGQISDAEAAKRYREMMAGMDETEENDEVLAEYERAFSHLSPEERRQVAERYLEATRDDSRPYDGFRGQDIERASDPRELGKMTRRAAQKDPDLLEQVFGENSKLTGTGGRLALAGLAAFAASRFLGRKR